MARAICATTSQAAPISRTAKKGRVMSKLLVLAQIAVAALPHPTCLRLLHAAAHFQSQHSSGGLIRFRVPLRRCDRLVPRAMHLLLQDRLAFAAPSSERAPAIHSVSKPGCQHVHALSTARRNE